LTTVELWKNLDSLSRQSVESVSRDRLAHGAAEVPGIISFHSQNFRDWAYIFRVHDGNCERLRGFIANDSSKEIPMKRRKTVRVQVPPSTISYLT